MEDKKETLEQEESKETSQEEKRPFLKGLLYGIAITLLVGAAAGLVGVNIYNYMERERVLGGDISKTDVENKVDLLLDKISQNYLNDYDNKDLAEGIYSGLVSSLGDQYSVYYTREEYAELERANNGVYEGIGAVLSQDPDTKLTTIVRLYEDSPAEKAGIQPGDIIQSINKIDVTSTDVSKISLKLRKEGDSTIHLKIYRKSDGKYYEFDIERSEIDLETVASKMLDDKIGYIIIAEFDANTADQFNEQLEDLKAKGMKGLIIDVRDNPGGLVSAAASIADPLLPEGLIVYTEDKNGSRKELDSKADDQLNLPLAVLINGNSASASEILAGAVKDYGVGTLVGTTSFGKGIVQTIMKLSDGSAIKLTTAKYYTPKGNNIHGTGIEPDVEIEMPEDYDYKTAGLKDDPQIQKAIDVVKEKMNTTK